jgi:hypothetical protein
MDDILWMGLVVLAIAAVLAFVVFAASRQKHRGEHLKERFGREYDHALEEYGDPKRAEDALRRRADRVEKFKIAPLSRRAHDRFSTQWDEVQRLFVDDPINAVRQADGLVVETMRARGYPVADFEQRVADLSVDHGDVVQHYRAGRALAKQAASGEATTEDLRQAMIHFRALFADLLETRSDVKHRHHHVMHEAKA